MQVLAFTRHMAARMPNVYTTATDAVEWTRLTWVPDPGTRYANGFSEAAQVLAADSASTTASVQLLSKMCTSTSAFAIILPCWR